LNAPHSNRLSHSASPYLRSAASQPVDWYEWGDEAFARAAAEQKPILLDIGAVWCHWCHVIDRESYENPEIAALINQLFIAVKVDRDERPDVDSRYQTAVSAVSGQGGWPLTAFLTPAGIPFFGGTYFPPDDAMGRPGFRRVLISMSEAFRSKREDVERAAVAIQDAVKQAESSIASPGKLSSALVGAMTAAIVRKFDPRNGGFGQSPKFPHPAAIDLLLECYQTTSEQPLLTVAETTLEKMARGGVYDQIGGGFHRYSVDERWLVPHFEKMACDNSELLKNYLHAWQVTGNPLFRETAEGIIRWVFDVLCDREKGGFYSSQDADISLDDDGDYFTWTLAELRSVLSEPAFSKNDVRVMELFYDVGETGEMHHDLARNVLWVAASPAEIAIKLRRSEADVRETIARAKSAMLAARAKRTTPAIDSTIYVGGNGLFISAFLEAARVLDRSDCRDFALKTLDRILAEAWDAQNGFLHRVGGPRLPGVLDDQVFMAGALLDAWEFAPDADADARYFRAAQGAMDLALEKYFDPAGGFFDRASDAAPMGGLALRRKPAQDSPFPSANSVAAMVLVRLQDWTGEARYGDAARRTLETFAGLGAEFALYSATLGLAVVLEERRPLHVIITGAKGDLAADDLERAANSIYRFGKAVIRVPSAAKLATSEKLRPATVATAAEKLGLEAASSPAAMPSSASMDLPAALRETLANLPDGPAQALVCVGATCHAPIHAPAPLTRLLTPVTAAL
jgi:uncharacterized protein YyaL (SSP411 family)